MAANSSVATSTGGRPCQSALNTSRPTGVVAPSSARMARQSATRSSPVPGKAPTVSAPTATATSNASCLGAPAGTGPLRGTDRRDPVGDELDIREDQPVVIEQRAHAGEREPVSHLGVPPHVRPTGQGVEARRRGSFDLVAEGGSGERPSHQRHHVQRASHPPWASEIRLLPRSRSSGWAKYRSLIQRSERFRARCRRGRCQFAPPSTRRGARARGEPCQGSVRLVRGEGFRVPVELHQDERPRLTLESNHPVEVTAGLGGHLRLHLSQHGDELFLL